MCDGQKKLFQMTDVDAFDSDISEDDVVEQDESEDEDYDAADCVNSADSTYTKCM